MSLDCTNRTSRRAFQWGMLVALIFFLAASFQPNTGSAQSGAPTIEITSSAVQTFYQEGVPQTDAAGNPLRAYSPGSSFFPNGIYYVTPCHVSAEITWAGPGGEPPAGWDGEYQVTVNVVSSLTTELQRVVSQSQTNETTITATRLPASTQLHYAVRLNGTDLQIEEGLFVSSACADPLKAQPLLTAKMAGFNFSITVSEADTLALLPQSAATGLKLVSPGPSIEGSLFSALKRDGRVFGWYLADEPLQASRVACLDPAFIYGLLKYVYDLYAGQTSQVIFLTESNSFLVDTWGDEFIRLGDAGVHDYYLKAGRDRLNTVRPIASSTAFQTNLLQQAKPSWVVLQAFGSLYPESWQFPTPQEARATVFAAIIHGATGIVHFAWDSDVMNSVTLIGINPSDDSGPQQKADLWNALASSGGINEQIGSLAPVLLSSTSKKPYRVFVDQTPLTAAPIRTMLKEYGTHYYLLAVNLDDAPIKARFDMPETLKNATELFESSPTFVASGASLADTFEPFDVHVYRFDRICTTKTVTPPVDVNGDGQIDITDYLMVLALPARMAAGGPYTPVLDFDKDGHLTITDQLILQRQLGPYQTTITTCS